MEARTEKMNGDKIYLFVMLPNEIKMKENKLKRLSWVDHERTCLAMGIAWDVAVQITITRTLKTLFSASIT